MPPRLKNYYVCTNGSSGLKQFYKEQFPDLKRVYLLNAGPGTAKDRLLKKTGDYFFQKGFDIDYIYTTPHEQSLAGLHIPALQAAVLEAGSYAAVAPGSLEEYVNLTVCWNPKKLTAQQELILELTAASANALQEAAFYQQQLTALGSFENQNPSFPLNSDVYAVFEILEPAAEDEILLQIGKASQTAREKALASFTRAQSAQKQLDAIYDQATNPDVLDGFYRHLIDGLEELLPQIKP